MKDLYYYLSGLKLVSTIFFVFSLFSSLLMRTGANEKFIDTFSICLLAGSGICLILIIVASIAEIELEKKLGIE